MKYIAYKTAFARWTCKALATLAVLACCALLFNCDARADDWMTWASTYTHEPATGQRVDQFAHPVQPTAQRDSSFQRSGYRNYRSTLQGGNSADNIHIVEQWGAPVVPYEQWRFPYRPYGTPYDAWGPQAPYGIINGNFGGIGHPNSYPPHGYNAPPGSTPHMGNPHQQPNMAQPPFGYPGSNQGYPLPFNVPNPANGFPLSPQYLNQPWYDGTYPTAPPLDNRTDAEFFFKPEQ